jgi:hypothetical protein
MYNHCMISLSTLQLHRHRYSLSKSIEFVNFINEFRCLVIRACLLIGQIPCFSYPSGVFSFVVEVGCNGIASGP